MRITGGKWKGRRPKVAKGFKGRPTTDFGREGLFNLLKTTFWFLASHAGGNTPGAPQAIEGITGVHWLPAPVPDHVRSGAYPSILALMDRATAASSEH